MTFQTPTVADLLAFDGRDPPGSDRLRLRQVIPVASVEPEDLLALVQQIDWSGCPALARILGSSAPHPCTPEPADETHPKPANGWHPIPGQGIDGRVGGFDVLVGTAEFVEDAGITIPDDAHRTLAEHRARGWASILVGACYTDAQPSRRSLLGIVAVGPDGPVPQPAASESPTKTARPSAKEPTWPADLQRLTEAHPPTATAKSPRRRKTRSYRLSRLALLALLVGASAVAGLLFSITIVEPDEVMIVQRFGRIAVCESGMHLLPFWLIETRTLVRPGVVHRVDVFADASSLAAAPSTQPAGPRLLLTGDVPMHQEAARDNKVAVRSQPAASAGTLASVSAAIKPLQTFDVEELDAEEPTADDIGTFAGLLVEVSAHVEYTVSDPEVYVLSEVTPGPIVAAAARGAIIEWIASRPLLEVVGHQRADLAVLARAETQKRVEALRLGVRIEAVTFDRLDVPRGTDELDVPAAFEDVSVARIEAGEAAHRARIEAYRILADTRTRAVRILADAITERARLLQAATGMGLPAPASAPAGTSPSTGEAMP